jgi:RluA family pseudouridine synthase
MPVHAAGDLDVPDLLTILRRDHPYVGLLHRLDREASGLVLVTLRPEANAKLQRQLEAHEIERVYAALLAGELPDGERIIDRAIPERSLGRAAVRRPPPPGSQPARSRFVTIKRLGGKTLVDVTLETGRKHQIRVHAASIGHPIIGDRRYGTGEGPRLMLHARRLRFRHPSDDREILVDSPAPFTDS